MLRNGRILAIVTAVALGASVLGLGLVSSSASVGTSVQLHLGGDGRYFQSGTTTQTLTTGNNSCVVNNSAESLMHLTSTGTHSSPGLNGTDLGVKGSASSGNGTPCGQVDGTESLTLTPGTSIAGRSFTGVHLDLEMTGNAVVKLTLAGGTSSQVYQLQTGTSITAPQSGEAGYDTTAPYDASSGPNDTTDACAAPNSSGPNSGFNDNCEWAVTPGFNFDHITLTTSIGTVSLEGGNDFGNNPAFNSVFDLSANSAPTPVNDTITTTEDTAVTGNVLDNDTDPEHDTLSATLVTGPLHGTLTGGLASNGAFTYTPALNYYGSDPFTYAASDGPLSTNATANITVSPVNDAPVANDDTAEVNQHESLTIDVTINDNDVEGDTLTPTSVTIVGPDGSTAFVNPDRTVTFTAPPNYTGAASFTYKASDGQAQSNTATVNITVYQAICTDETVSVTAVDVTGSFTRLSDTSPCKRYTLAASSADDTVSFVPTGNATISYRAFVSFGPDPTAALPGSGPRPLQYDPAGGINYRLVPWCLDPHFDTSDRVTSATIPAGNNPPDTWCIAQADIRPDATGRLVTIWQVFGRDDPVFHR